MDSVTKCSLLGEPIGKVDRLHDERYNDAWHDALHKACVFRLP